MCKSFKVRAAFGFCAAMAVCFFSEGTRAQAPPQPSGVVGEPGNPSASRALFLAAVLQPLVQTGGMALANGVGDLIRQFFSASVSRRERAAQAEGLAEGGQPLSRPGAAKAPTYTVGSSSVSVSTGFGSPNFPAPTPSSAPAPVVPPWLMQQASAAPGAGGGLPSDVSGGGLPFRALLPSVIVAIERLNPTSFNSLGQMAMGANEPAHLRTGDVFAVRFATNLPGLLSIENTDAAGVHTVLGTYSVLPGADNRYPRRKGLALAGAAGLESYDVYFLPCVPAEERTQPLVAAVVDHLSACPPVSAATQLSAPSVGRAIRATINLDSPDPRLAAAVAPGFTASDVVKSSFVIQHDP